MNGQRLRLAEQVTEESAIIDHCQPQVFPGSRTRGRAPADLLRRSVTVKGARVLDRQVGENLIRMVRRVASLTHHGDNEDMGRGDASRSTVWYSHRRMNGLPRSKLRSGLLQNNRSGSSTVPATGPCRLARSVTTIARRPGRDRYCVRTATGLTASIPPTIAPARGWAKLCSKDALRGPAFVRTQPMCGQPGFTPRLEHDPEPDVLHTGYRPSSARLPFAQDRQPGPSLGGNQLSQSNRRCAGRHLEMITDFGDGQLESADPGEQDGSKRPAISGDGERRQARETAGRAMSGDTGPPAVSAWHARGLGFESP
jgi:hypothetical protein